MQEGVARTWSGNDRRRGRPERGECSGCPCSASTELAKYAANCFEFRLLRAAIDTNTRQFQRIVDKVRNVVTRLPAWRSYWPTRIDLQGGHR